MELAQHLKCIIHSRIVTNRWKRRPREKRKIIQHQIYCILKSTQWEKLNELLHFKQRVSLKMMRKKQSLTPMDTPRILPSMKQKGTLPPFSRKDNRKIYPTGSICITNDGISRYLLFISNLLFEMSTD